MEPEGSSGFSQVPTIDTYSEPSELTPPHLILFEIHFNIILSTSSPSGLLLSGFPTKMFYFWPVPLVSYAPPRFVPRDLITLIM
jgi:hypothetical protein